MSKIKFALKSVKGYVRLSSARITGNNISFKFTDTVAKNATVKTENNGRINFSKVVQLKQNVEVAANGGTIELKGYNYINRNTMIVSHESISIGEGTTIGPNVVIYDHDHDKKGFISEPIVIGKNVWIGAGCTILKGVTIGDCAVVGAGTLVSKDVKPNTTVINKRNVISIDGGV